MELHCDGGGVGGVDGGGCGSGDGGGGGTGSCGGSGVRVFPLPPPPREGLQW